MYVCETYLQLPPVAHCLMYVLFFSLLYFFLSCWVVCHICKKVLTLFQAFACLCVNPPDNYACVFLGKQTQQHRYIALPAMKIAALKRWQKSVPTSLFLNHWYLPFCRIMAHHFRKKRKRMDLGSEQHKAKYGIQLTQDRNRWLLCHEKKIGFHFLSRSFLSGHCSCRLMNCHLNIVSSKSCWQVCGSMSKNLTWIVLWSHL